MWPILKKLYNCKLRSCSRDIDNFLVFTPRVITKAIFQSLRTASGVVHALKYKYQKFIDDGLVEILKTTLAKRFDET